MSIEKKFKKVKAPVGRKRSSAKEFKANALSVELGKLKIKLREAGPPKIKQRPPDLIATKAIGKLTSKQERANYHEFRMRMAARDGAAELGLTTMKNAAGHDVKMPDGPFMHHRDKQKEALRLAKGLGGEDRKFALKLAKSAAKEKRAWDPRRQDSGHDPTKSVSARYASAAGQKRVPKGRSGGGRWTK